MNIKEVFDWLCKEIEGLGEDVIHRPRAGKGKSMKCYCSRSATSKKIRGLAWPRYPKGNQFIVSIRKTGRVGGYESVDSERRLKYHQDIPGEKTWGEYVEFSVGNMEDAEYMLKIIKYAYKHF